MNVDTEKIKAKIRKQLAELEAQKSRLEIRLEAIEVVERIARELTEDRDLSALAGHGDPSGRRGRDAEERIFPESEDQPAPPRMS